MDATRELKSRSAYFQEHLYSPLVKSLRATSLDFLLHESLLDEKSLPPSSRVRLWEGGEEEAEREGVRERTGSSSSARP